LNPILPLVGLCVLAHASVTGSRITLSLSGISLGASTFAIGMMLSLYSLLPIFTLVSAGRWVDRVGVRKPILLCLSLTCFGLFVPFAFFDLGSLFLAPVCMGSGFMIVMLCVQRVSGIAKDAAQRRSNFSLMALGFSVGGLIGPLTAGYLIDHIGHRYTFGVLTAMMLTALAGFAKLSMPDLRNQQALANQENQSVLDLLKTPELRRMYVCVALLCSAWDIHQFLVPIYGAKLGLSASQIGLILGSFALATIIVRVALPWLATRVREWPLILTAMGISVLVYGAYPLVENRYAMQVLAFILGLGLGLAQPMILSLMYKVSPPDRIGEAAGLRLTLVNVSQTALPMLAGAFGTLGFGAVFITLSMGLAGGIGYVVISKRSQRLETDAKNPDATTNLTDDLL
jgi:predicted MFS family arabinose efflux permease